MTATPDVSLHAIALLTIEQVAARLGVSYKTVQRMIESQDLPALKVGKRLRVREDTLRQFLDRGTYTVDRDPSR